MARYKWEEDPIEKAIIVDAYKKMLRGVKARDISWKNRNRIRKAFEYAADAHHGQRRKAGGPYITHPLAVAQIVVEEMHIDDPVSIMCALLHDVVEDTDVTLDDIEREFGRDSRLIIDGLTKIGGASIIEENISAQAENFKKIFLTISNDIRVVLIKLADRLHNMRTLGAMKQVKKMKIASETEYLYAPLANRLGLHEIKSQLEDLSFRHKEPDIYKELSPLLEEKRTEMQPKIDAFEKQVKAILKANGLKFKLKSRFKTVYSIYSKMLRQEISFEDVFDLFAMRIILKTKDDPKHEKDDCWKAYSVISQKFRPNPLRIRDWISMPKENGYESLHVTVNDENIGWVEVQIRSKRMDNIAEHGVASHWMYKDDDGKGGDDSLFEWINEIRNILENPDLTALEAVRDFREQLEPNDRFVFTPKGEVIRLHKGATVLDFAFKIHTRVGASAIGAKVGKEMVGLDYKIKTGDQIQIITSKKQIPKEEWLSFVQTTRAREAIKKSLNHHRKKAEETGRKLLKHWATKNKFDVNDKKLIQELLVFLMYPHIEDVVYGLGAKLIDFTHFQEFLEMKNAGEQMSDASIKTWEDKIEVRKKTFQEHGVNMDELVLSEGQEVKKHKLATCCRPMRGDGIFGFLREETIEIHRTSCQKALGLMANFGGNIVQTRWADGHNQIDFLVSVKVVGYDKAGMLGDLVRVITSQMKLNMKKISIESQGTMFEGIFKIFIHNNEQMDRLLEKLEKLKYVISATREASHYNNG